MFNSDKLRGRRYQDYNDIAIRVEDGTEIGLDGDGINRSAKLGG